MIVTRQQGEPILTDIAICVPVRNEVADLPRLFTALDRLERQAGKVVEVCLLLDGCSDGSAALAAAYRERSTYRVLVDEVAASPANAGLARHRAMMLGLVALDGGDGLLLTTDADSRPAPGWLGAMTAALHRAEVVAGRIVRTGSRPSLLQDRVETYYDALFALRRRLDPVPWEAAHTHHHTGGANMGIRAEAYRALGGFAPVPSGEDARLVDDAARAGLRVRRDAASMVHTSDRRIGRAGAGLAVALRHADGSDAAALSVAHPIGEAWRYRCHAFARSGYATERLDSVAAAIGLSHDHVRGVARDCRNGEAFAMRVVPAPPGGMRMVTLPLAEIALAKLVDVRQAA